MIEKCKDFEKDGYGTRDDSSKPTTYANMYDFMKNQNNVTLALANSLWQPSTAYVVGAVIHSPSLPAGCKATCTTEGTSGSTEPKWTAYGTTVTDGTVKWAVETDVQGTITGEVQNAITNAINSLHDTIKTEMQTAMLALFPVGTILETTNSANPSTYIGGAWEQLGAGLTAITAGTYKETHNGTEDTYVFTAGSSNFTRNGVSMTGEAEHVITEGELASHSHIVYAGYGSQKGEEIDQPLTNRNSVWSNRKTSSVGGDQPHNTIQPVYGVYRYERVS